MNCGICYAHLREKNKCPGCRLFNAEDPISIANCKIRNCDLIKTRKAKYCFECDSYPCKNLKNMDKRYRSKYNMSEIENLECIKEYGVNKLIKKEKEKWTCSQCSGIVNVHKQVCSQCGKKVLSHTNVLLRQRLAPIPGLQPKNGVNKT
jgi:hypothetical protein